jgi:hypothetical protein
MVHAVPNAPAIVARIAQQYARTTRGIVGYRYDRDFSVSAGPTSRHDRLVFEGVNANGAVVRVRIVQDVVNGKTASAADAAQTANSYEHPKPGDVFEAPFDPRFVRRYSFRVLRSRKIAFAPVHPVYGTGSGTFLFDARDNVTSYDYAPSVLPPHATTARIIDRRRQVLPGYWAVTSETQTYGGHYAIFGASGQVRITVSGFRRFPNVAAAVRALSAQNF